MTDERLAEIEARLKAATPGPWVVANPDDDYAMNALLVVPAANEGAVGDHGWGWDKAVALTAYQLDPAIGVGLGSEDEPWKWMQENAAFIASSPEDIRDLLAEVRRLRGPIRYTCGGCGLTRTIRRDFTDGDSASELPA